MSRGLTPLLEQTGQILGRYQPFAIGNPVQVATGAAVYEQAARHFHLYYGQLFPRARRQHQSINDGILYRRMNGLRQDFAGVLDDPIEAFERDADDLMSLVLHAEDEDPRRGCSRRPPTPSASLSRSGTDTLFPRNRTSLKSTESTLAERDLLQQFRLAVEHHAGSRPRRQDRRSNASRPPSITRHTSSRIASSSNDPLSPVACRRPPTDDPMLRTGDFLEYIGKAPFCTDAQESANIPQHRRSRFGPSKVEGGRTAHHDP